MPVLGRAAEINYLQRLSLQHGIWSILFGGLNPPALHDAINASMVARDSPPPAVLDVGCGSGSWFVCVIVDFRAADSQPKSFSAAQGD